LRGSPGSLSGTDGAGGRTGGFAGSGIRGLLPGGGAGTATGIRPAEVGGTGTATRGDEARGSTERCVERSGLPASGAGAPAGGRATIPGLLSGIERCVWRISAPGGGRAPPGGGGTATGIRPPDGRAAAAAGTRSEGAGAGSGGFATRIRPADCACAGGAG